jgi:hypothetical protein
VELKAGVTGGKVGVNLRLRIWVLVLNNLGEKQMDGDLATTCSPSEFPLNETLESFESK